MTCQEPRPGSPEGLYYGRFPSGCTSTDVPVTTRRQLADRLRVEFKKVNVEVESIGVMDVKCARGPDNQVLGAVVLAYGTPPSLDAAYERFNKSPDKSAAIQALLNNEQFGVFQFDGTLTSLTKTLTVMRSERWRDFDVSIELSSASEVAIKVGTTYSAPAVVHRIPLLW